MTTRANKPTEMKPKTLEQIIRQLAELPDERDVPLSWTNQQLSALRREKAVLERRIHAARSAAATLAALPNAQIDEQWRDHLTAWRKTLGDELLALPARARERAEVDRERNLELSIRFIDFGLGVMTLGPVVDLMPLRLGELMHEAGYATTGAGLRGEMGWRGSIPEVEQRIVDLAKRRATAQAALDEALMDDDARAKRDAESAADRQTLNGLRLKGSDYQDGQPWRLVPHRADGSVIPESELSPVQRKALERANAAL
jgi:hypothetical protein